MTQVIVVVHLLVKLRVDVQDCEAQHLLFFKLVIQRELCLPARVERVGYRLSSSQLNPTLVWPADQTQEGEEHIKMEENFHREPKRMHTGSLFEVRSLSFRLLQLTESSTW